jgi:hypothetical protein
MNPTFYASGGGASIENCGNTRNEYTTNITINIDMRGTSREQFTNRLEQLREIAGVLGLDVSRRDVQWAPDSRLVQLTQASNR